MKNIKFLKNSNYVSVIFISFAIVTMLQALLFKMNLYDGEFTADLIFQIFITCFLVSLFMCITDYIFSNFSEFIRFFIRMLDMYIVVFIMQVIFYDNIPITIISLLLNLGLLFLTYFFVYVVLYILNMLDVKEINKKIKERKQ